MEGAHLRIPTSARLVRVSTVVSEEEEETVMMEAEEEAKAVSVVAAPILEARAVSVGEQGIPATEESAVVITKEAGWGREALFLWKMADHLQLAETQLFRITLLLRVRAKDTKWTRQRSDPTCSS